MLINYEDGEKEEKNREKALGQTREGNRLV